MKKCWSEMHQFELTDPVRGATKGATGMVPPIFRRSDYPPHYYWHPFCCDWTEPETNFTKIILKINLWLVPYFCLFGLAGSRSATLSPR